MPRWRDHTSLAPSDYALLRQGHHEDRRFEAIEEAIACVRPANSILEIGCGGGSLLHRLATAHPAALCTGIEIAPGLAKYAREKHGSNRLRVIETDVTELRLPDSVDFVLSVDVIHHLSQPLDAFRSIRASMRLGGRWLAFEPNMFNPYIAFSQERMKRAGLGEDHFRPWRMIPQLHEAGLALEHRRYLLALPSSIQPSRLVARVERLVEWVPVLGATVAILLRAV